MTNEQTVPVPVAALKRLRDERDLRYIDRGGALYSVRADAMVDLLSAIPTPPKVGDVIDTDEAARDLPAGTVLRDNTGDIWFVATGTAMYYVSPTTSAPFSQRIEDPAFNCFKPVIISLPEESK